MSHTRLHDEPDGSSASSSSNIAPPVDRLDVPRASSLSRAHANGSGNGSHGRGGGHSRRHSDVSPLTSDEEDDILSFPPAGKESKRRGRRGSLGAGGRSSESRGLLAHVHDHPHGHGDSSSGGGAGDGGAAAGPSDEEAEPPSPNAANPNTLLFVFTCCNLLTYFDRGSIGVALTPIMTKEVYDLTNFEGGVLAGAYMVGYIVASPCFALAVRKYDPFRIISFGLSVWALAALGCACSIGFVSLLMARAVSGIGEAAFLCIAPPFIDKCAPSANKSRWMATFYCAIPLGYALGFVVSGHWLNASLMDVYYQWRMIFVMEAILMVPFILWCLATETPPHSFADPPPSQTARLDELNESVSHRAPVLTRAQRAQALAAHQAAEAQSEADGTKWSLYFATVTEVLTNKVYMLIIFGYSAQTFVLGSVAYFGVKYLVGNFGYSVGQAGSYFGGITVVVGVLGSFFGGWLCDYIRRGKNKAHATAVTMKLAFSLSILVFPLCLLSFAKNDAGYFFGFFVVAEFILFATASPINSAVIWSVPFRLAPLACSLSIMFIHIFGDAVSPAIIGAVLDWTHNNWRMTMTVNTCWLGWSVVFWGWAWRAAEAKAIQIDKDMVARGMPTPDPDGQFDPTAVIGAVDSEEPIPEEVEREARQSPITSVVEPLPPAVDAAAPGSIVVHIDPADATTAAGSAASSAASPGKNKSA